MADERSVRCDIDGVVATLTIDRPERHNGITTAMVVEVYEELMRLSDRQDVRIVVLTGRGERFFCPGADLEGRTAETPLPESRHFRVPVLLHEMPQLTIAAVNGAAAGAGLSWACACDLRVAAASARFNTAFLDVGVAGDMGLPWSLSHIVGSARARDLFLRAGRFGAEEALAMGLVSAVYDDGSFRKEVAATVTRLIEASPSALRALKANFLAAERMGFADYVDLETERHMRLVKGSDFREGTQAFMEHRRPRFS